MSKEKKVNTKPCSRSAQANGSRPPSKAPPLSTPKLKLPSFWFGQLDQDTSSIFMMPKTPNNPESQEWIMDPLELSSKSLTAGLKSSRLSPHDPSHYHHFKHLNHGFNFHMKYGEFGIYNRMEIIEGYKQKARESVINLISSLQQENEEETSTEPQQVKKQLIQEIDNTHQPQDNYEEEQFKYFAGVVKQKQHKCVVCKKIAPKYTCPKCHVRYCSIDHYKAHNLFCTQKFFKEEVQSLMKRTKAAGVQRGKMIQMLRQHGEEQTESQSHVMQETKIEEIKQTRLDEIMNALENGKEIELTDNQVKCFENYLREIQEASLEPQGSKIDKIQGEQEDTQLFEEYIPFWTIQQGLQQYFLIDEPISVQIFNTSNHKTLLQYRQQTSIILRKQLQSLSQSISFKKTSIFICYDLVQLMYLTSLLFRLYNGDYLNNQDFLQSFLKLYQDDLSRNLAENQPTKISELPLHSIPTVIPLIKTKISNVDKEMIEILRGWLPFVVEDSIKIFKNKYYCIQALYRLCEVFKSKTIQPSFAKHNKKKITQMIKKIEFLLVFANEIVYTGAQKENILPNAFIETNCLKLIGNVLEMDRESQGSLSQASKNQIDKQTRQKQEVISKMLAQ